MKHLKNELDVDYIGGEGPLSKGEQEMISRYIKSLSKHRQVVTKSKKVNINRRRARLSLRKV
jgi:hypothetical protein